MATKRVHIRLLSVEVETDESDALGELILAAMAEAQHAVADGRDLDAICTNTRGRYAVKVELTK